MPAAVPQLPDVVERFRNGETVQQIASDPANRASIRTIYRYLLREMGDEMKAVQRDLLVARIADCDQMLLDASNAWEVNRAIACAKFSRYDYERRAPEDYGPRQAIDQQVRVTIRDIRPTAPVIEAAPADDVYVAAPTQSLPVGEGTHE